LRTKIIEFLEAEEVPYRLLPHSEAVYTVEAAAAQRGVVQETMVKCILLRDKGRRYVMAGVTGEARLDPKAVRAALAGSVRRLSFASAEEILEVTGYEMGAVAPLCLPDGLPVVFDEAIAALRKVSISSGDPMAGLELDGGDLIRLSRALLAPIAERG
jgi:prolyl-tRNA editing enzyme YbaK/EbsC (Cys-tRNA(Pro) deacylase)